MLKRLLSPGLLVREALHGPTEVIYEKFVLDFGLPSTDPAKLVQRCDQGLGGFSTLNLDKIQANPTYARFHGHLSQDLPEDNRDIVRLGYAYFRTQFNEQALFRKYLDWSMFSQVGLRVRGDDRKYFVNIQADTPYPTDLYQHRLFLKKPGEWETVTIPLSAFVLTNAGSIQKQHQMDTQKIKSLGIGLIDGTEGSYSLDIGWLKVFSGPYSGPPQAQGQSQLPMPD